MLKYITTLCKKVQKKIKKLNKSNIARHLKNMTKIFTSIYLNTIIYTKECCFPCLLPNKPSMNHFMRERAIKAKKNFKKPT